MRSSDCKNEVSAALQFSECIQCGSGIKNKKMLLWNAYRRNPLFLGLHETIDPYTKSVLRKQHAFEQFFLYITLICEALQVGFGAQP